MGPGAISVSTGVDTWDLVDEAQMRMTFQITCLDALCAHLTWRRGQRSRIRVHVRA
jgi:hypothetical protein